jgi:hypothetical protein
MAAKVFFVGVVIQKEKSKAVSSLFELQQQQPKNTIADFVVVVAMRQKKID